MGEPKSVQAYLLFVMCFSSMTNNTGSTSPLKKVRSDAFDLVLIILGGLVFPNLLRY